MTSGLLNSVIDGIKAALRRAVTSVEEVVNAAEPTATPPPGATSSRLGDLDRETSTNAQLEGAAAQPWGGNS
jgi:hypothetical protein